LAPGATCLVRAQNEQAVGYFEKNGLGAYSPNDPTAELHPGGAFKIQFGGCQGKRRLSAIMSGRNYMVRLYRPRKEIVDVSWKFPEAQPGR
jgi:hypothetical protein